MSFRVYALWLFLVCVLLSAEAFAQVPVRGSSRNGTSESAGSWNLYGPTLPTPTAGGDVNIATQVVCPEQDVSASDPTPDFTTAGSCVSGHYLFLIQIQTNRKKLTVTLSNLIGFTPDLSDSTAPTYGVNLCDDTNDRQLCTTLSQGQPLPQINFSFKNQNSKIVVDVRKLAPFLQGTGVQGRGLTLAVETLQTPSLLIAFPKISVD